MKSIQHNNTNNQFGFTLIEVLIALCILVFISFGIYQATLETYKLRDVLSNEGNFYNSIRLAMSIMERDVELMYSPTVLLPTQKKEPLLNGLPSNGQPPKDPLEGIQLGPGEDLNQPYKFWSPAVDATGLRPSRFTGTDNKMSFISLTYSRIYKDTPGSDFAKVAYELKKDDHPEAPSLRGTLVLVKTESANAFTKDDQKGQLVHTYELLHGIKKLNFEYYFRDGDSWKKVKSWDSEQDQPRTFFPDMIVITFEVVGPKNLSFDGIYKFRPEIPIHGLPANI